MAAKHRWPLKPTTWQQGERSSENKDQEKKREESNIEKKPQQQQQQKQYQEKKWVHNLSNTALTEVQEKVLAHGPNFAVVTNEPPIGEYIAQIERMCQKMKQGEAEELRGQIKLILKNTTLPKPNIIKEEARAIKELRRDQDKVILTADKGVSMVVMEMNEYIKEIRRSIEPVHLRSFDNRSHQQIQEQANNLLKTIKAEGGIDNNTYKRLYPTGGSTTQILWSAQNTQAGHTTQAHNIQQGLSKLWDSKRTGKDPKAPHRKVTPSCIQQQGLLESIKDIKVEEDECIMSYDVTALLPSIPIDTTINIIKKQLEDDKELQSRTNMTIKHICCLLEFCLKNTYFKFTGEFYEQKEGAAMGSPISPIVANLFMEDLEIKAIRTSNTPPKYGEDL